MRTLTKYFTKEKYARARLYLSFYLLGMAMVWSGGRWLVFVALLPLLSYLPYASSKPLRQVVADFYMAGFLLCGFANLFLYQVAPENWTIELRGWFGLVSRFMSWILVSGFCALAYAGLGFLLAKIKTNSLRLLMLPFLFALAELVRSYLFAIMAYGPHGKLSPNFNWGSIAVPASGTPIVYNARVFGFFGITLFVVVVNICLYLMTYRRRLLLPIMMLSLIVASTLLTWSVGASQQGRTMKVASVHLNEKSDMTLIDNTLWPQEGTDLLVLPEYSAILKYKDYKKMLGRLSEHGVAITSIDNGRSPQGTNRIIILNRNGDIINSQDKTFLIPTGEYIPYSLNVGFRLIGKSQAITDFTYSQQLTKGTRPEEPFTTSDNVTIGALACSGVGSLTGYKQLTNQGADVLTNSASLAFLLPDSIYHTYAHNMARFQAVSNNRPFVQASRSGQSYIIDNQGSYITVSDGQSNQLLSAPLQINN